MKQPTFEVSEQQEDKNYAKFVISPLERGYGDTLGNALRRVLLSSLPGAAITSVRITGVRHQFSSLKGMRDDVVEFLLNLKKVRLTYQKDQPVKATLSVKGPGEVRAKDIKVSADVKIANPEMVLTTLNKDAKLEVEIEIQSGTGYSPANERKTDTIGLIPLDASFSPISRVNYKVEETRVGRVTNFDKLTLEIWTDGTISPKDSLIFASKQVVSYFEQIVTPKKVEKKEEKHADSLGTVGKLSVEEIGLPTRVANALMKAGYESVEGIVNAEREDLVKVRNLGEKSLKIISAALGQKGIKFSWR
ncbi:DNA-directed RNA polymerase subunit alpha [Candidatus Woesebacteria bacterium]|nr:DNA-directed RNA polymerase subunit alpha [Candidatus Woesebacteria bacterium]